MIKMRNSRNSLKKRCRIATQEDGDRFVGIKIDVKEALIYFPLGFQIADDDTEIRQDILHLLNIIKEFKDKEEGIISSEGNDYADIVEFPLNSYLEVIGYYMENGYFFESESRHQVRSKGKINWSRTINSQIPLIQENNENSHSLVYTKFIVKEFAPLEETEVININKYCVYESFKKIGWLFTSFVPPKPIGIFNKEKVLPILHNKLVNTFIDAEKRLFLAMINILNNIDDANNDKQQYFGTENFEHIWESLIDNMIGIPNKEDYYPRAQWNLSKDDENDSDSKYALQPDTIMVYNDNVYVIDAKYYRYGYTKNPLHLPKSTDVNKQITYAEFVQNKKHIDDKNIYNAFLMPFNKNNNLFDSNDIYLNIGEVVGDWRTNKFKYDHIQAILVDIKFLMYNYMNDKENKILQLAKIIEEAFERNNCD